VNLSIDNRPPQQDEIVLYIKLNQNAQLSRAMVTNYDFMRVTIPTARSCFPCGFQTGWECVSLNHFSPRIFKASEGLVSQAVSLARPIQG